MLEKMKPPYEDYKINLWGDVFSVQTNRMLTPHLYKSGYSYYSIRINGKFKMVPGHRMTAIHFYGDRTHEGLEVNHVNGVKNVEWVTKSENCRHRHQEMGKRGAYWFPKTQTWRAAITIYSKGYSIGYFKDIKDAYQAYFNVYKEWYGKKPW